MSLITSFHFSLGTLFEPDFDPSGDPRLDVLFAVAEFLDGVLFTPSSLRDAGGRILFGAGGEDDEDPDATWPRVMGEVSVADPSDGERHDEDLQPPTPGRVALRALALAAVTTRAILEQGSSSPDAEETYRELLAWTDTLGIRAEMEPEEWSVLQTPPGDLDGRVQIYSTWRLEGLVILAWALGRFDIPPHDRLVDTNPLWKSLALFDADGAKDVLANPSLRAREEIGALRSRLFALHWRLRNYSVKPGVLDFAEFARTCWFGPLDISGLPLVEGDLGLRGDRIDHAPRDLISMALSVAQERHQAANWLWEGPRAILRGVRGDMTGFRGPHGTATEASSSAVSSTAPGTSASSARRDCVGSPMATGQMWKPPRVVGNGGHSQRPQIPLPSL